ncbi:MAG: tRNA (5-methylaminomethyl-2-thiouridine)(34)-methyltransferase MnmD [Muribaculaceae bacterium]|nr:tRNA (5-methylaminomethyl-2-thiouridine)(34)-methyltransferase MnmD [Muribaculaceae bacterium]
MELTPTDDGSPTLYLPDIDEHYHSTKGAVTESLHVYVRSGFLHRLESPVENDQIRVLEIGFGTGLNASLTASVLPAGASQVRFISIEKHPLDKAVLCQLDFGMQVDKGLFRAIHSAPWNYPSEISPGFILEKRIADFLTDPLPEQIDVIYMDAFGPDKQPEMWTPEALSRLVEVMAPGAVLTTYSAKGIVRRTLASLGLTVERLAGPPGGKREILRATKP